MEKMQPNVILFCEVRFTTSSQLSTCKWILRRPMM